MPPALKRATSFARSRLRSAFAPASACLQCGARAASAGVTPPLPLVSGPSVWDARLGDAPDAWRRTLSEADVAALGAAADAVLAASPDLARGRLSLAAIDAGAVTLAPAIRDSARMLVVDDLLGGRGFAVVRGVPVAAWGDAKAAAAFGVLCRAMGSLRPQNAAGHVVGHVTDLGLSSTDPRVRVYQTRERQTFHTDSADVVALLCLRTAAAGGESFLVSAGALWNALREREPALLPLLTEPLATDRRGEVPPGARPYFCIPPFTFDAAGAVNVCYQRQYVDSAQRFPDAPRLTPVHVAALDALDAAANDPALHVRMVLEPGDAQFIHNHALLHDRAAFVDDATHTRHLLRAWVAPPAGRALPAVFAERYGSVAPGDRGGVLGLGVPPVAPWRVER